MPCRARHVRRGRRRAWVAASSAMPSRSRNAPSRPRCFVGVANAARGEHRQEAARGADAPPSCSTTAAGSNTSSYPADREPAAEVDVLAVHEEALVEAVRAASSADASHEDAGTGDPVRRRRDAHRRPRRGRARPSTSRAGRAGAGRALAHTSSAGAGTGAASSRASRRRRRSAARRRRPPALRRARERAPAAIAPSIRASGFRRSTYGATPARQPALHAVREPAVVLELDRRHREVRARRRGSRPARRCRRRSTCTPAGRGAARRRHAAASRLLYETTTTSTRASALRLERSSLGGDEWLGASLGPRSSGSLGQLFRVDRGQLLPGPRPGELGDVRKGSKRGVGQSRDPSAAAAGARSGS